MARRAAYSKTVPKTLLGIRPNLVPAQPRERPLQRRLSLWRFDLLQRERNQARCVTIARGIERGIVMPFPGADELRHTEAPIVALFGQSLLDNLVLLVMREKAIQFCGRRRSALPSPRSMPALSRLALLLSVVSLYGVFV